MLAGYLHRIYGQNGSGALGQKIHTLINDIVRHLAIKTTRSDIVPHGLRRQRPANPERVSHGLPLVNHRIKRLDGALQGLLIQR